MFNKRLSAATRISMGLVSLTVAVMLASQIIGLWPSAENATVEGRKHLCEALAVQLSLAAAKDDTKSMRMAVHTLAQRNSEVRSVAVRDAENKLLASTADHETHWGNVQDGSSTPDRMQVPLFRGDQRWGKVEIAFAPLRAGGRWAFVRDPVFRMLVFVAGLGFLSYLLYLRKTLQHLDPSAVIPERVRAMLDALAEGVLVLDRQGRIVLANGSFGRMIGQSPQQLLGRRASALPWAEPESGDRPENYPWNKAVETGKAQMGLPLILKSAEKGPLTLTVNAAAIGDHNAARGVLATFDDVTSIEQMNAQLRTMLSMVETQRTEIERQNQELQVLATQDPLTGCLNRRSFFQELENHWKASKRYGYPVGFVMVDIDRFKSINDTHGHAVGDRVLQQIAEILRQTKRGSDLLCRYGGEEFCLLLPHTNMAQASRAAERLREAVDNRAWGDMTVTVSVGVSSTEAKAALPQDLLNQADTALYAAKHGGRNRTVTWHEGLQDQGKHAAPADTSSTTAPEASLSFSAVTALISALTHRDLPTAHHSRKVADLCVDVARSLLSAQDCYLLEVAALLHDIGKLGVPDSVLLKPGPLSPAEREILEAHDRMGVQIVDAAFRCPEVTRILQTHYLWYDGSNAQPQEPRGEDLPLSSRLLSIADAYDAITADRPYRKARPPEEAFAELRRAAGTQFDPELVEHFIGTISQADRQRPAGPSIPQRAALQIALEMESLACAVDTSNQVELSAAVARLATAPGDSLHEGIAQAAAAIQEGLESEFDWGAIGQQVQELLDVCRSAQAAYLQSQPTSTAR